MGTATVLRDGRATKLAQMENALLHRLAPSKVKLEAGREFYGNSIMNYVDECLKDVGFTGHGRSKLEAINLAFTSSSDLGNLLANVANKRLRQAYEEAEPTYRRWARRAPNAPDFKQINAVELSGTPDLLRVNEAGEFKYSKLSDGAEVYSLLTYGRILPFTRQSMVNDDLRGFDRIVTGFGSSAARLENRLVYSELTANAALSDSIALFHASHGNLVTPGTAISATSLGVARGKMRAQTGLNSETLDLVPRFLIVPAALEQLAYQFTSNQFVPATAADVNEFRAGGRTSLEPVVEGLLDSASPLAWYLSASQANAEIEYCFLEGQEEIHIDQRQGFEIDGMEFKARLDFAAKAVGYRGLVKNDGAA